jgi:hypothetical protein
MEETDICFMLKKDGNCSGNIRQSSCGAMCPFKKTRSQQFDIEKGIVRRFEDIGYIGTFRSRLSENVLYKCDGVNQEVYI